MSVGRRSPGVSAVLLLAAGAASAAASSSPGEQDAAVAAAELWRRGRCILSAVVVPAQRVSQAPRDLRGARPVEGRTYSGKVRIAAWARDERSLWVATDTDLHQIDLAGRRRVRSWSRADGLPDWPVDELLSDGRTLWVVHRRGLATLRIGHRKVEAHRGIRCRFARLHRDEGGVWVLADDATWRFRDGAGAPQRGPAVPTGTRIGKELRRGIWLARRSQKTAYFISDPTSVGGRLYAASYGAVFELAEGQWRRVAAEGWAPRAGHGSLWFLSTTGLVRYDPTTRTTTAFSSPKPLPVGRPTHLAVTKAAVWVAVEPREDRRGGFMGGGLARLEVASGQWRVWKTINGHRADRATALEVHGGSLWAAAIDYQSHQTLSAHPGMMHCKRTVPVATALCLHRYVPGEAKWETVHLGAPTCERRRVLGQRGKQRDGVMAPRVIDSIAPGTSRLLGVVRMFPKDFYSGYYTCIDPLATRQDPASRWEAAYAHHPEQLNLEGEQPSVLLISESHGKRIVYAEGHDHVLGLFTHGGRAWAVAEGCVGSFDPGTGRWQKVLEPGFRFYWKATAALDDGRDLWIGSDRGLVARLELSTNRFERLAALKDRQIVRVVKQPNGQVVVASRPAERGCLPAQLEGKIEPLDCNAAAFDGKRWTPTQPPPPESTAAWRCDRRSNFLMATDPATGKPVPRFYLLGVFQPRFLCASPDGRRLWLATYSGLARVDTP